MAFKISRFAMFLAISASHTPASQGKPHPLCRTLGTRDELQPAHFPYVYTCHGDDADATCAPWPTEASGASTRKVEPEAVTWWVFEGQRQLVSSQAEDAGADEWVDCTNYYARGSRALGPSKVVGKPPRRKFGNTSQTLTTSEVISAEPKPRAVREPSASHMVSQDYRTLQTNGARGSAGAGTTANRPGNEENAQTHRRDSFMYAPDATCDDVWLSWPAMQERAIARGTVLVFNLHDSVGNLFRTLNLVMQFVRFLDIGLIMRWTGFPGFGEAFNPGEIQWNLDPGEFLQQIDYIEGGAQASALHEIKFRNYIMVLSDSQLELLALILDVRETNPKALATHFRNTLPSHMNIFMRFVMKKPLERSMALGPQPCAWNMLLSRSLSMVANLEKHSPWRVGGATSAPHYQTAEYVSWHIRTSDGETARSYHGQPYVIQEPSSDVCPTFLVAMDEALRRTRSCRASLSVHADDTLVFISSNSKSMAKDCTLEAANNDIAMGHVDMGLNASDAHTAFSNNPLQTALGALLDFLFLMDSTIIVRTASSFSGTVADMKGMHCHQHVYDTLPKRHVFICLPSDC